MGAKNNSRINPAVGNHGLPNSDGIKISPFEHSVSEEQIQSPRIERPSIRTMKSDVDRLFKTAPPSIAQMITKPGISQVARKSLRSASAYIVVGVTVILFLIVGTSTYYFRNILFPPPVTTEIKKATPPAPLFATETSRTIEISQNDRQQFLKLMSDSMKEFERNGTIKHILVKLSDTPDQRFINMSDFLALYHIVPPESLLKRINGNLMTFVYTMSAGTRLGLAMHTSDRNRTLRDMLDWEQNMFVDFKPLFFGADVAPLSPLFEDRSYRNIDWRYLKLSLATDIGIGYTIFPAGNILVITTSKELMETAINRLFDAH